MQPQGNSGLVRLFARRSILYKVALFAIIPSFCLYLLTFISSPWILVIDDQGTYVEKGLWINPCEKCRHSLISILIAIRSMACICVAGYVLSIIFAILDNFRLVPPNFHSRKLEWALLFTGCVGIMTDLVYLLGYFVRFREAYIEVHLIINMATICFLFVAAAVIMCTNRNPQVESNRSGQILSSPQSQPLVVQYTQGQPQHGPPMLAPYSQANYPLQPSAPLLPHVSYNQPGEPPPYQLPPSYPGDNFKS